AADPVAAVVAHPARLGASGGRLDLAGVRFDAEVAVAQVQHLAGAVAPDLPAEQPTSPVYPAVQPILQAVDAPLVVLRAEAGVELRHLRGLARPGALLRVEDVRGGAHQHALAPDGDPRREGDVVEEDRRFIEGPVAV